MKRLGRTLLAFLIALPVPALAEDLTVFHAGSLGKAMAGIAQAFTAETGLTVKLESSGSGSLRQRIERGERPDLFASADLENPRALAAKGLAEPPVVFVRNIQVLLARKTLRVTPDTFIDRMLDPGVKVGTSTPISDPGGDYAWKLFDLVDARRPGAGARLKGKAIKLVGDPALPLPPAGYAKSQVTWHFEAGRADLFPAYLTTARIVAAELPEVEIVTLPPEYTVGAQYGLSLVTGARPGAERLKAFILGPRGQAVLRGCGFAEP